MSNLRHLDTYCSLQILCELNILLFEKNKHAGIKKIVSLSKFYKFWGLKFESKFKKGCEIISFEILSHIVYSKNLSGSNYLMSRKQTVINMITSLLK